jgi:hypothetical protein
MDGVCVLNLGAVLGETVKLNVMEKSKCKASKREILIVMVFEFVLMWMAVIG